MAADLFVHTLLGIGGVKIISSLIARTVPKQLIGIQREFLLFPRPICKLTDRGILADDLVAEKELRFGLRRQAVPYSQLGRMTLIKEAPNVDLAQTSLSQSHRRQWLLATLLGLEF